MMRVFAIPVILTVMSFCLRASVITNDNTSLVFFASSYDIQPYHYFADYVSSWVALNHPQFTNHWISASRGGGSIAEANQNRLERLGLAQWADGQRAIGLIMADDDGGYTSNDVRVQLTNTFAAPGSLFNGTAYTNEGGWASTQQVTWIGIGAIPHDDPSGDDGEVDRNNAVTNMCAQLGLLGIDMWYPLWSNGWSNDEANTHYLGFYPGSHPYASGSLAMGITIAQALAGADTNVSLATVDWNASAVASTNHCVISGISRSGNVLTFTRHDDRLPMAWDVPDGTITNDCRNAFLAMPGLSNAFWFTIAVTNLPAGNYNVSIDGQQIVTLSSSALAAGWNMFASDFSSQYWRQRVAVLSLIRLKNGADPVTLLDHNAGDYPNGFDLVSYQSYSQSFWDLGYRGDALISALAFITTNLNAIDKRIHDAAQPTNHVFTIAAVEQTITFPPPGDQTYGVSPLALNATASSGLAVVYSVISGPASVSGDILTITGAGPVTIQADQPGDADWPAAPPVTQTIFVAQRALDPSISANNKIYDGTSVATLASQTVTGTVGSDAVTLTVGAATFPDKAAGTSRTVTATELSLSGTDAANYVLSSTTATTTADITPLALTVTGVTAADLVYDGDVTATVSTNGAALVGVIGTDDVTLSGTAAGTFADSNAGTGKIVTVTGLTLSGADAQNYELTQPTTTASITEAATSMTITSSLSPAPPGGNVSFTSSVTAVPPGAGMPTGTVIFKDGTNCLGTNSLDGSAASSLGAGELSHGSHTITAEYQGDGNFLGSTNSLLQVIDTPPQASDTTLGRYATSGVNIRSSTLLANDTDGDGDPLTLVSVSATSAFGGTITTNGDWISYQPPAGFTNTDSFTRVIADSTGLQSTSTVSVVVIADTNAPQNYAPSQGFGGHLFSVKFYGIPDRVYTIQYSTNVAAPDWQTLGTATANSVGFILFVDDPPTNSPPRTYRTTYP